ncbi:MAG: hypothetical protein GWM98_03025, partial [Nitrospinaceae bacterium]|nr:hypothetical protein [Nitrospinaceae bacterium]NIT80876.1 hypothetical protein [Nitrospinaceae bacterium]NIX33290.1 hypothetical protein [Nitrospinaceae bacterium]NIY13917.1 hypothetical protein [Nitrospinaceae bacterium]
VLKVFVGLIVFGSFLGLLSGLMIVTTPEKFRRLSHTMDHWVSTQPAMDALEKSHSTVDEWVIKHHIAVGLFLFLGSIFLVFACTQTFLR